MNNESIELRWGTQNPISYNDLRMGNLQYNVRGICKFKNLNTNINDEIAKDTLYNSIINCVYDVCNNSKYQDISLLQASLPEEINNKVLNNQFADVVIDSFQVTGIELTEASMQVLNEFRKSEAEKRIKESQTKIVQTDEGATNGQTKCPNVVQQILLQLQMVN